ncbi:MAG: preprotein translocase subunit SecE [Bacilli bacterium]|nr:preprotein translocase subunit SecE [Bacilli bacterium]
MAEVQKKKVEDKYNTSSIKKKEEKTVKKVKKNVSEKKEEKVGKKNIFVRFRIFCNGVKNEFKKVHWTSKEDMVKYSISTILFIIFCSLFFYLIDIVFALIRSLFA